MPITTLTVPDDLNGKRLDVALATLLPDMTRSAAQRLIDAGRVEVASLPPNRKGGATPPGKARAARSVSAGETLVVNLSQDALPDLSILSPSRPAQELAVVYQDRDMIIVDKPAGVVVHPGAGHHGDTLVNTLLGYDAGIAAAGDPARPGIVHRLDKDTSGLIAIARTPAAHAALARQWREHTVVKRYLALVRGHPRQPEGIVEMPIGRDPRNRKRMAVTLGGRPARTSYRVAGTYRAFSLLDVAIETGRTHQIRVHLAALGHPVAGDHLYGGSHNLPGLTRQFLHAYLLGLRLPSTGEYREFTSPLPSDLQSVLQQLQMPVAGSW